MRLRRRFRDRRGQSLVEVALAAPVVIVLLVGSAQVGTIMYGQITIDTATKEGARVASVYPNGSGTFAGGIPLPPGTTITCPTDGSSSANPVCNAVWNAAGFIPNPKTALTVTIKPTLSSVPGYTPVPGPLCPAGAANDGYINVTVTYNVPIFVPFLNHVLSTNGTIRTIQESVTSRVAPCTVNKGQ